MKKYCKQRRWGKSFLLLAFALISTVVYSQSGNILVKGIIKDDIGEPVIGANVLLKGTMTGTITDFDGRFELNVPSNGVLTVTYIGYIPQEVPVNGRASLNITLLENREMLKEVVVIGYGSVKKEDLTGSVVAIKAEQLNKGAITSPQELLQGKVAGVFVQPPSGQPGGESTLRIRGGSSLNASNDPLIVVDGVPLANDAAPGMANGLSSINPNDIETFTVLKDASATAIYGSRASNGVIIITTKRGGSEKYKVSYNSTYSINDPYKKVKTLNAKQYREMAVAGVSDALKQETMDMLNIFPDQSTNWQDKIFKTAYGTDQNVSISGTTLNTPYRASFGYNNEDGVLKKSNYKRYTVDLSVNPKFFDDHLSVNINIKGVYNKNRFVDDGAIGTAAFYDPTKPVYNPSSSLYNGYWNWTQKPDQGATSAIPNREASANPVGLLFDKNDIGRTRKSTGNIQLDYKLHWLPELRLNLNLGYDVAKGRGDKGPNQLSFDTAKDDLFTNVGRREYWDNFRRNTLLEYYMNYEKDLDEIKSRINVMGGYSYQRFYYANYSEHYSPMVDWMTPAIDDGWISDEANGKYIKTGAYRKPSENYLISFFGRANYVLMDRYMLTATVRRDGSSRFYKDNRWGTFTSAALAWTITEEAFMKNQSLFSNLKLRVGYGSTGQQDLGEDFYPYFASYIESNNSDSMYLDEYLLKPGKFNKDLKWETTDTYNIALDFGFLSNRINGTVEYYKKKTKDLLGEVNVAAGTNFSNRLITNVGKMENQGVEFNVNAVAINTKDFGWDVGFNITWNKSEITKLVQQGNDTYPGVEVGSGGLGTSSYLQKHMVGYAPFTFNLYQQVYDEEGNPIQDAFVDRNGDGEITEADRYLSKSPTPKVFMGFNSMLRYKDFDFGFNLRANIGNYAFNEIAAMNSTTAGANGGMGFLTNLHETVYRTGFTRTNTAEQSKSDYFLENASFLKMDNMTLGYNFSRLMNTRLSGRLSFTVQNVFTITKYKGLDPENSGIDGSLWPRPRTYTLGVNLNF